MKDANVSIVICTRNRAESLRQTLESIARVEKPKYLSVELIVVDNGSTDATASVARDINLPGLPVRYVLESRPGLSFARNAGIATAAGDFILFCDDDVRPSSTWLAGMCAKLLSGKAEAVAGGITIAPALVRPWMTLYLRAVLASTESLDPDSPGRLIGANMAVSRGVFSRIPLFDSELGAGALGYGEETLFASQLLAAGFRIAGALNADVEHHFDPSRLSRRALLSAADKSGRSEAYKAWHWSHEIPEPCDHSFGSYRRDARMWAKLVRHRIADRRDPCVPTTDWEFQQVKSIAFRRQLRIEMQRPRQYERRGLMKVSPHHGRAGFVPSLLAGRASTT